MDAEPIGARIRRRRQQLRMKQRDLASALGVPRSTVSTWERGIHYPGRYLGALEQELGVSLGGGERPVQPAYDDPVLQAIWDLPPYDPVTGAGLTDEEKRGLIALALGQRAQRRAAR